MSLLLALQGGGGPATLTADLAATEAQDTAAFSVTLVHPVTFAVAETADAAAFAAALKHGASFAITEGADVAAFAGALAHPASFALTEAADVAAFDATVLVTHTADLAVAEAQDAAAFAAALAHTADLAATESQDVAAFDAGSEETGEEDVHHGGKGDNKHGAARRRSIFKPTGLALRGRQAAFLRASERADVMAAKASVSSGSDADAADAFLEQLRGTPFANIPVAQISSEQIDREIGALMQKPMLAADDEMLLVILLAAAATA